MPRVLLGKLFRQCLKSLDKLVYLLTCNASLTHIIPASQLTEEYLLKILKGIVYSMKIMHYLRNVPEAPEVHSWRRKLRNFLYNTFIMTPLERKCMLATRKAKDLADRKIQALNNNAIQ